MASGPITLSESRELSPVAFQDVCILIPTLNEASSIAPVIKDFKDLGFENILVIDGRSTDGTQDLAKKAGARVVVQSGSGKGQAMAEAFDLIDQKYILLIDGDGTYLPS